MLKKLSQWTLTLAAFSLLLSAQAYAEECKSLDECMNMGQQAQDYSSALDFYNQGIAHWKSGDAESDLALATLIRAETHLGFFGETLNKEHLELAAKDFQQVIKLAPKQYNGYVGLALVEANRGDHDKSKALLQQAIDAEPQNPLSYFERGRYYFIAENFDEAVNDISTAVGMLSQKNYDKATDSYKVTEGVDLPVQQRVMLYALRAQAYMQLGEEEASNQDLDMICSLGEKSVCRK